MKKILIATGVYPPESGGPATNTAMLEEYLPKHGFEVSVLPFRTVRHLPPGVRHAAYWWRLWRLSRKTDYIFAQDTVSVGFPAALAARVSRTKLIVRVPGDYAWEQGRARFGVTQSLDEFDPHIHGWRVRLLHWMQSFTVRSAVHVIAPSAYQYPQIVSWGVPPERVVLIYNGIKLPIANAVLPTEHPDGFLVVSVGRFVPWKHMDGLIRVVSKESSWKLVLVGDGPETPKLKSLVKELGVDSKVSFVGQLDRAHALGWVRIASAYVINSSYEGLAHQLLEAMALGVPIIATRVGGNTELIKDEKQGLLIPAENDEALHAALKRLHANPEEAKRFAEAAALRAKEFAIEKTVDKLVALLNTI